VVGYADGMVVVWGLALGEGDLVEEEKCRPVEEEIISISTVPGKIVIGTRADVFLVEAKDQTMRTAISTASLPALGAF
jgi:hypothetical protein